VSAEEVMCSVNIMRQQPEWASEFAEASRGAWFSGHPEAPGLLKQHLKSLSRKSLSINIIEDIRACFSAAPVSTLG